jgi:hypothetical protein
MGFDPSDPIDTEVAELIRQKARKLGHDFRLQEADVEDVEGHLKLFILQNAHRLVAHTAAQKTVIDQALRNEICNLVHHRAAKKRDGRRNIDVEDAPESAFVRADGALEAAPRRLDLRDAIDAMPPALGSLADLLLTVTPTEAQRRLSLTRGQLRHRMELIEKYLTARGIIPPSSQSVPESCQ